MHIHNDYLLTTYTTPSGAHQHLYKELSSLGVHQMRSAY